MHSSESGKCIHIKSENGYWYCHSCQQGGDAVAAVKSLQGLSTQDAITYLTQHFGPPRLPPKAVPHITSATELLAQEFPTLQWAVEGLLPEGSTLCAARPKKGKSFLALGLCVAVASGGRALGSLNVTQGDVLYLALEDGPRRLQARLHRMLNSAPSPARLYFSTEWPRLGGAVKITCASGSLHIQTLAWWSWTL